MYPFNCKEGTTVCHTPDNIYHNWPEPSCSDMKVLDHCPYEYKAKKILGTAPPFTTSSLDYGTLLHTWGELGEDIFWPKVLKPSLDICTSTGAMGAKAKAWAKDQSPEAIIVSPADYKKLRAQTRRLLENDEVVRLMQEQIDKEFNIRSTWDGHKVRARVDGATEEGGFDWKTTSEKYPSRTWAAPAKKYKYHLQSAWYTELLTHVGLPRERLRFIVTSTVWPYENFVCQFPESWCVSGHRRCLELLEELQDRIEWDCWSRPHEIGTVELDVPAYLLKGD